MVLCWFSFLGGLCLPFICSGCVPKNTLVLLTCQGLERIVMKALQWHHSSRFAHRSVGRLEQLLLLDLKINIINSLFFLVHLF